MQRPCSLFQYLAFRPNVTFDEPATPDGKSWNAALKYISQTQGWSQLHWGARLDSKTVADLLIAWNTQNDLRRFMSNEYKPFLTRLDNLLLDTSNALPQVSPPHLCESCSPSLELGAVSSIYELRFPSNLNADDKTILNIAVQMSRNIFQSVERELGDQGLFLGKDADWVEPYHPPVARASSSSLAPDPTPLQPQTSNENDISQIPTKTLLIMTHHSSTTAEHTLLNSGHIESTPGEHGITAGCFFRRELLQRADSWTKHQVVFENVLQSNVDWLDEGKEEKWSTWVERLMAEEEERKKMDGQRGNEELESG